MTELFTIFGASGFIGSEVARQLEAGDAKVRRISRGDWPEPGTDLGHAIFTIGMTADFRSRLVETVETQVVRLHEALTRYRFRSFLGLSSARVYEGAATTREDAALTVRPATFDHVYNISKLAGESLIIAMNHPAFRVARLSNVYGATDASNLFMTAVLREAITTGRVSIGQAPDSAKDYIAVDDAARQIIAIARGGRERVYNVACGENFSHRQIAGALEAAGLAVSFKPGGATVSFPPIDISRARAEFGFSPRSPAVVLPELIGRLKQDKR